MQIDTLTPKYTDSEALVKKGDSVIVDNRFGTVREVCMIGSPEAANYCCEDTGGFLIDFDDGSLELLSFGHHHRIEMVVGSDRDI